MTAPSAVASARSERTATSTRLERRGAGGLRGLRGLGSVDDPRALPPHAVRRCVRSSPPHGSIVPAHTRTISGWTRRAERRGAAEPKFARVELYAKCGDFRKKFSAKCTLSPKVCIIRPASGDPGLARRIPSIGWPEERALTKTREQADIISTARIETEQQGKGHPRNDHCEQEPRTSSSCASFS
jgi:hypothetical protein